MPEDQITTEDLYGKSTSQPPPPPPPEPVKDAVAAAPLQYEETPEIPMPTSKKKSGCLGTLFTIVIFLALFIGGIWISSFVRQFFPGNVPVEEEIETTIPPTIPETTTATDSAAVAVWKTYNVISGTTKQPFAGVTFQLPPDVLSPICDGAGCASQGTYLPGGTRFTVALRGAGQALRDFRGSVVSDVGGTAFATKTTTVAEKPATEFTGTFIGRTVSGYGFSHMRGVMIELSPTTSLEVNHFAPSGIVADFASDDVLFDAILKTITISVASPSAY